MVFAISLLLIVVGTLLFRNQKRSQQKEDFWCIDFQFRIMIYMLIGSGIILMIRELIFFILIKW